jgi:hypothetical protein
MIFLFEEFAYEADYLKEVIGYRGNSDFQSESGFNTKAADMNGDGLVTVADAVQVIDIILRKE